MVSRQTQRRMSGCAVVRWLNIESSNVDLVCPSPKGTPTVHTYNTYLPTYLELFVFGIIVRVGARAKVGHLLMKVYKS